MPAPLQDWPSHLARVWITARVLDGDPFWTARYELQGFLIPNAVLDVGVLGLMRLGLDDARAGQAFLVLVFAVFVGGFCALARSTGGWSRLTPALGVACFYSTSLFYGLVNFVAGVALMLWALAAWRRLSNRPGARAALAVAAAVPIAFCHIIAAFLFVGIAGCVDLAGQDRGTAWRRRLLALVPAFAGFLAVAALFLFSAVSDDKLHQASFTVEGSFLAFLARKAVIFARAMASGRLGPDALMAAAALALIALAARGRARVPFEWGFAALATLGLALLAPDGMGEGAFFDARLAPIPFLLATATLRLRAAPAAAVAALGLLLAARTVWLAADWREAGRTYAALQSELAQLPKGAMLLAGLATPRDHYLWIDEWDPPLGNITSLAAPLGVFVPTVFASPVQQPLALRREWRALRHYMDMTPPGRAATLERARQDCARAAPIWMLVVHYPVQGAPARSHGAVGERATLVPVC